MHTHTYAAHVRTCISTHTQHMCAHAYPHLRSTCTHTHTLARAFTHSQTNVIARVIMGLWDLGYEGYSLDHGFLGLGGIINRGHKTHFSKLGGHQTARLNNTLGLETKVMLIGRLQTLFKSRGVIMFNRVV